MEDIYKSYINSFNLFNYRGFDTSSFKRISYNNFLDKFNFFSRNNNIIDIYVENQEKVCVINFISSKSAKKLIERYNELILLYNLTNKKYEIIIVIILKEINNDDIRTICDEIDNLTIFNYKNIIVNIMEHSYVPIHIKLNDSEKLKLKDELKLKSYDKLPYINKYDPVSKILGLNYGDICLIKRKCINSGENNYYRYCCRE